MMNRSTVSSNTPSATAPPPTRRVVLFLFFPAALLAVVVFGAAIVRVALAGGDPTGVDAWMVRALPWLLAINHVLVLAAFLGVLRKDDLDLRAIGWTTAGGGLRIARELALGAVLGVAVFYTVDEGLLDAIRRTVWEPSGSPNATTRAIDAVPVAFLLAATALPWIEETVYRGYGIGQLRRRIGLAGAIAVSTPLFGLLHWGNGAWGIFAAVVIALPYIAIYLWRKDLWAVSAGHSAFNLVSILHGLA